MCSSGWTFTKTALLDRANYQSNKTSNNFTLVYLPGYAILRRFSSSVKTQRTCEKSWLKCCLMKKPFLSAREFVKNNEIVCSNILIRKKMGQNFDSLSVSHLSEQWWGSTYKGRSEIQILGLKVPEKTNVTVHSNSEIAWRLEAIRDVTLLCSARSVQANLMFYFLAFKIIYVAIPSFYNI